MEQEICKEKEVMLKLCDKAKKQWIITKELDAILLEVWGNEYDARMHCNSLMRRGFIDYFCDGDWEIYFTKEDVENEENWK